MSEEETEVEEINTAPGLLLAYAPAEDESPSDRRRNKPDDSITGLRNWVPKTRLGHEVMAGRIITYEDAMKSGLPIREVEIVDALIPNLEDDIIKVNMVQRMTDSGRRVRFNVMACVGNRDGYVGLAMAKGKEVSQTIRKAITAAKLNLIQVQRGNGSWESSIGPGTSVPFKVQGQAGSTRVTLMSAPAGKGLVIGETGKRVLQMAGITDVLSRTKGQTQTTINYAAATFNALAQVNRTRVSDARREALFIHKGRMLE
jgi:small subunit ribosomal protein S5|tara:strand:+ start:4589 stop:5362 length:774 start_codon:yes stop_codon:yes gene_type:complete